MSDGESFPPLLVRVDRYRAAHRLSERRFSLLATGHPNVLHRLRKGRTPQRATLERIEALLAGKPVLMTESVFKARRYGIACSAAIREERAAQLRRARDPLEQAALHLRRNGYILFRASVLKEGATGYMVGTRVYEDLDFLALARAKGWVG